MDLECYSTWPFHSMDPERSCGCRLPSNLANSFGKYSKKRSELKIDDIKKVTLIDAAVNMSPFKAFKFSGVLTKLRPYSRFKVSLSQEYIVTRRKCAVRFLPCDRWCSFLFTPQGTFAVARRTLEMILKLCFSFTRFDMNSH